MTNRPRHRNRPGRKPDLSALYALGCTCHAPSVETISPDEWPEGLVHGIYVWHERGCPMGTAAHVQNLRGYVPQIVQTYRPGNRRRASRGGK